MEVKIILILLNLAVLWSEMCAANLGLSSLENIQDIIIEEKLIESLVLPATIKEERAVLPAAFEAALVPERDVTFQLFTRSNPDRGCPLKVGDVGVLGESLVRPGRPLKVVVHGWTDMGTTKWVTIIRYNYLSDQDCNVVIVNWFPTSLKEYFVAAKLTEQALRCPESDKKWRGKFGKYPAVELILQIGAYVGDFLNFLHTKANISLANVHILGHSLGAHIAGFAGARLSGRIGRITGMDPARPGFEAPVYKDQGSRLDPSDAEFVDVIHTCAGTLGFIRATGHADFYPNGGSFRQPGCSPLVTQYCSHGRSHQFMAESIISPRAFVGTKCDSWAAYSAGKCENSTAVMGDKVSPQTRGAFFLETNSDSPFGKGDFNSVS